MRTILYAAALVLTVSACNREPNKADPGDTTNAAVNAAAAAAPVAPILAGAPTAASLPAFVEGTPYPQVRQKLRQLGWSPYTPPGDMRGPSAIQPRGCAPSDDACRGFAETIFCIGASSHSCWHAWRRGETYLLAVAEGEMEGQLFGKLRECSAIVVSNEDPWQWCMPVGRAVGGSVHGTEGDPGASPTSTPKLSAKRPTDLDNFLELFPRVMPAWQKIVPSSSRRTDWIYELAANSSDVRYVHLGDVEYAHGGFCKPHDCFDNNGSYLITLDGSRAVGAILASQSTWTGAGWVRNSSRETYFGNPSRQQRAMLRAELYRTAF